jgi:hypothetical protein
MTDEERTWLRQHFDRCAGWIQDALDRDLGTHELEDVWDAIAGGRAQLWPGEDYAVVTALEYHPRKVVLRYWLCGSDRLEDCLKAEPAIEKWAKEAGAVMGLIGGREGWKKALKGYRKAGVYLAKEF